MSRCDLLVTGAGGFVGRHLVQRARQAGLEVALADRDLSDVDDCDLRDRDAVARLVAALAPAAVVHLAASPRLPGAHPLHVLADDLAMAGNVLAAVAEHAPGAPVLIPGSAAQYGMARPERLLESDALAPLSAYGASKCVLERACTTPELSGDARVIWARAFNHVGPGQGPDAPVAQWAGQVAAAEEAGGGTLRTGTLDVVRDFLDVRDVADAYLALVRSPARGAVNVCSGEPTRLGDLAQLVADAANVAIELELDPALKRRADPPVVVGDPGRLRELTGFRPRIALADSVAALLDERRAALHPASPLTAAG